MAPLKLSERLWIARLSADRLRRTATSTLLSVPPFRWRFGFTIADQLLIVPQDLRTADPSFWDEVELGQFGLAGTVAIAPDNSPFAIKPPNEAWARALHSFDWLRHMDAAGRQDAQDTARNLAVTWAERQRIPAGVAWEPEVVARRIIAWISHSPLLLESADARAYGTITESLGEQLIVLSTCWRNSPSGYPRLLCLSALMFATLCLAEQEQRLAEFENLFLAELSRQILPDGGHVSRNPGILVELMLEFLPLRQCFVARGRPVPPLLASTMQAMVSMLKFMRLGDGKLARFNGMAVASPAGLATVLAYDDEPGAALPQTSMWQYVRLDQSGSVLIMDAGSPPAIEAAGEAHAGCLSFEFSAGTRAILVNGGAPGDADADWKAAARATASHNTLCLGDKSSSKLIRNALLEDLVGGPPIRFPDRVVASVEEHGGGHEINAKHDGYLRRFGLWHRRTLVLNATGRRLLGVDRLDSDGGNLRLKRDIPFSIHFHLHPDVLCKRGGSGHTATIVVGDGETWHFSVEGAELTLEESTYFADSAGPRSALQIVARGTCHGETEVRWILEAAA
jgi:uncharacterized heparinase superfamily protein